MNVLRTLGAKLFYIMLISASVAVFPCWKVYEDFARKTKKTNMQLKAVELLDAVAVFSNNIYAKENKLPSFDKNKLQSATDFLSNYYEDFASSNLKIKTLFSKNALMSFQQKRMRESIVADMASTIAERASLYSDSKTSIRVLMEVSGESIPSIMSDVFAFSIASKKNTSENKTINSSSNALFLRFSNQTRSMIYRLGKTPNSVNYKVVPEIFEKINRLNLQLNKIENILTTYHQGTTTKEELLDNINTFEAILFDIWTTSNSNLISMLQTKIHSQNQQILYFFAIFGSALLAVIILVLLISRSIVGGVFRISKVLKCASNGNIADAMEAIDEASLKSSTYNELNENVVTLVNYMSELIDISKNIANVSNRVNLMINGMNATKTPLLVSVKDSFSEVNKQIKTDYDFILQEVAKLNESVSAIAEIERNLKNAKKIGGIVKENIVSVSSCSGSIFNKLSESKSMLDKMASTTDLLRDSAEKINLLGLNLSVIAQKLGSNSAGAETLASQIRLASRQIAVAAVDIDLVGTSVSGLISESQSDNVKINEYSTSSIHATEEFDLLTGNILSDVSGVGSQVSTIATSLRSNVSSSFDSDSTLQDIDDVKDSIKDMASIVKKAGENVETLRNRLK